MVRTMYRLLAASGGCRERHKQLIHPAYAKPALLANAPNRVLSWDITTVKGPAKGPPSTCTVYRVLRALASIEHIALEDRDAVLVALDAFDKGLDFADALHLARSSRTSGFATFDQRLAKRVRALALTPPVELLG